MQPQKSNAKLFGTKAAFNSFHVRDGNSKQALDDFHALLEVATTRCSPRDVQLCKDWIIEHRTLSSDGTCSRLVPYLVAVSEAFQGKDVGKRRMYLLYVLNDLLHHTKYSDADQASHERLTASLNTHLPALLASASEFPNIKYPKLHQKLQQLLDLWEKQEYFTAAFVENLKAAKDSAEVAAATKTDFGPVDELKSSEEEPWLIPAFHGSHDMPWYELPAACMLEHLPRDPRSPIPSHLMRPIPLKAGPAPQELIDDVKALLLEAERLYDPTCAADENVEGYDMLGNALIRDPKTNKLVARENAYGWSPEFCEKMTKKQEAAREKDRQERQQRALELADQYERGHRREEEGNGAKGGRDRSERLESRPVSRSSIESASRSSSRSHREYQGRRGRGYSSGSRSRSTSRRRQRSAASHSRSRSRSRSAERSRHGSHGHRRYDQHDGPRPSNFTLANPNAPTSFALPGFPPPPPQHFPGQAIPPIPRPDGYTGPWPPTHLPPPPPPPILPPGMSGPPPFPPFPGTLPGMPFPNMPSTVYANHGAQGFNSSYSNPQQHNGQWQGQARGGHGGYGAGRGNWSQNNQNSNHNGGRGHGPPRY